VFLEWGYGTSQLITIITCALNSCCEQKVISARKILDAGHNLGTKKEKQKGRMKERQEEMEKGNIVIYFTYLLTYLLTP
jgi:hypothetical protein